METKQMITEEKVLKAKSGWSMLFLSIILYLAFIGGLIGGIFLCQSVCGNSLNNIRKYRVYRRYNYRLRI